jgi:hypothetical protein
VAMFPTIKDHHCNDFPHFSRHPVFIAWFTSLFPASSRYTYAGTSSHLIFDRGISTDQVS